MCRWLVSDFGCGIGGCCCFCVNNARGSQARSFSRSCTCSSSSTIWCVCECVYMQHRFLWNVLLQWGKTLHIIQLHIFRILCKLKSLTTHQKALWYKKQSITLIPISWLTYCCFKLDSFNVFTNSPHPPARPGHSRRRSTCPSLSSFINERYSLTFAPHSSRLLEQKQVGEQHGLRCLVDSLVYFTEQPASSTSLLYFENFVKMCYLLAAYFYYYMKWFKSVVLNRVLGK